VRLFIDSANSADIREALSHGLASGITTNPSLIAKEPPHPQGYLGHLRDVARGLQIPISVQPPLGELAASPRECVGRITGALQTMGANLAIKIPISWDNLPLIHAVSRIAHVNATCVFTAAQAIAAMNAGARYVSFFWCRMRDAEPKIIARQGDYRTSDFKAPGAGVPSRYNGGGRAIDIVSLTRKLIDNHPSRVNTEIVAGSIRTAEDAMDAFAAGAHIVTTNLKVLKEIASSELSAASAAKFEEDRARWNGLVAAMAEEQESEAPELAP